MLRKAFLASVLLVPLAAHAQNGQPGNGIAPPAGGSGLLGFLSGIYQQLNNNSTNPIAVVPTAPGGPSYDQSNPQPITPVEPTNQSVTVTSTSGNTIFEFNNSLYSYTEATLQTITVGSGIVTISPQYSNDGINQWTTLSTAFPCRRAGDGLANATFGVGNAGAFQACPMPAGYFRFQITSGTVASNYVFAIQLRRRQTISRAVFAAPFATPNGGCKTSYHLSGGSTASTNSNEPNSAGPFVVCSGQVINTSATAAYVKLYDLATAPTCSSTTGLKDVIPVLGNSTTPVPVPVGPFGRNFVNGLGFCIVGGSADNDNTAGPVGVFVSLVMSP